MTNKVEAITPPAVVQQLLEAAGTDLILVGGQALAFWVLRYDIPLPDRLPAISADVDFLTRAPDDRAAVERLAKALRGRSQFPDPRALTVLVGQAIRHLSDDEYLNVDVIFKVAGLTAEQVTKAAVVIESPGQAPFKVMHPLDVLRSRVANLYELREKQDEKGAAQLSLAIKAVRAFLRDQARHTDSEKLASGRSPIQGFVSAVEQLACEDAARKISLRWGIHAADAIDPLLIPAGPFWSKRWPKLRELMSAQYREEIERGAIPTESISEGLPRPKP